LKKKYLKKTFSKITKGFKKSFCRYIFLKNGNASLWTAAAAAAAAPSAPSAKQLCCPKLGQLPVRGHQLRDRDRFRVHSTHGHVGLSTRLTHADRLHWHLQKERQLQVHQLRDRIVRHVLLECRSRKWWEKRWLFGRSLFTIWWF